MNIQISMILIIHGDNIVCYTLTGYYKYSTASLASTITHLQLQLAIKIFLPAEVFFFQNCALKRTFPVLYGNIFSYLPFSQF